MVEDDEAGDEEQLTALLGPIHDRAPPLDIDDKREPGMTDEQLRRKILDQLEARGMDADVTVEGDHIGIRAHH